MSDALAPLYRMPVSFGPAPGPRNSPAMPMRDPIVNALGALPRADFGPATLLCTAGGDGQRILR